MNNTVHPIARGVPTPPITSIMAEDALMIIQAMAQRIIYRGDIANAGEAERILEVLPYVQGYVNRRG